MNAIREGDLQRVKQIVDDGFNLNFNYGYQFMRFGSPLSWAFRQSREIADFLIAHGASVSPKSPGNEALLVSAVRGNHLELIDRALAAGHNIHFQSRRYSAPLAQAVRTQSLETARHLISRGAVKEDIRGCRWHTLRSQTILFLRDLGIEVPSDVIDAVRTGSWDTPPVRCAQ
jgi:hypothetical protein